MANTYENYLETPKSLTFEQMNKLHQEKAKPQKRVDDAYKYVEKVEEGAIDTAPQKTVRVRPKKHIRQGRKPFFVRDRKNPNILYPYKD